MVRTRSQPAITTERMVTAPWKHYEEQQRQRSIAALRRRASALGFQIIPDTKTA
ncbi:hypothetical protein IQ288_34845 [Burkholderia sp. R-69980]|nr:hypothetical protein [Burkholderia sp. R-69980]